MALFVRRDVKKFQQQLMQDRSLKLEAFSRIDDLQAHVWDFEHENATSQTPGRIASSGVGGGSSYKTCEVIGILCCNMGYLFLGSISRFDSSYALAKAMRPSSCFPSSKHNRTDETKSLLTKRPNTVSMESLFPRNSSCV